MATKGIQTAFGLKALEEKHFTLASVALGCDSSDPRNGLDGFIALPSSIYTVLASGHIIMSLYITRLIPPSRALKVSLNGMITDRKTFQNSKPPSGDRCSRRRSNA